MYIVFDTETTGLPEDYSAPITDFDNWPRIVQLAWKVYDIDGNELSSHNRIIKPEGFIIPPESIRIHRITNERANQEGIPLVDALKEFVQCIQDSKFLIAHNISFDDRVTGCEFLRAGMYNYMRDINHVCTMFSTIDYCRIQGKMGLKAPTLTELHEKLFNRHFEDAHDAMVDVDALGKCFFKLKELGVLGFGNHEIQFLDSEESRENILEKWKNKNGEIETPTPMVHFGVHTFYSVLEGASNSSDYVKKAKNKGHKAITLMDKGNLSGSFDFYQKCKYEKIKPIIGCEFNLNDSIGEHEEKLQDTNCVQKIIVKDSFGFVNINKLNYESFSKGYYRLPRIKTEWIIENKEGLMLTTSSKDGMVGKYIKTGKYELAEEYIVKMLNIFGKQNYIAEISLEDNSNQRQYNNFIISMVDKYNMAIIFTHQIYYSEKGEEVIQDILESINQKKSIKASRTKENRNMMYVGEEEIMSMNKEFNYNYSEDFLRVCMITSDRISQVCNFDFETDVEKYPQYEPTQDVIDYFGTSDTEEIIRKLAHAKLNQKLALYEKRGPVKVTEELYQKYKDRLEYELVVIKDKKMLDYFLVVWELIRFCKKENIWTGVGRGSAAGSLLSYCLEITDIDPLRFDLYFERFLNPERKCMTENCYVLLKNGKHKKITDLTLEDEVQTETGKGKLVQIHERELDENDEVYEIETSDGATIQLTGNHIVPVFRDDKRIEIRVDEILKTDFLFTF